MQFGGSPQANKCWKTFLCCSSSSNLTSLFFCIWWNCDSVSYQILPGGRPTCWRNFRMFLPPVGTALPPDLPEGGLRSFTLEMSDPHCRSLASQWCVSNYSSSGSGRGRAIYIYNREIQIIFLLETFLTPKAISLRSKSSATLWGVAEL